MIKKVQVWVIFEGDVLLLRVIPERGGGWHPITANLEKGEKYLDAAKRETFEETGIKPKQGKWIELDFSFEYEGRWGRAKEHAFALVLKTHPAEIKIDPAEHTKSSWMSFKAAQKKLSHTPQKEALEIITEKLECIPSKI
jgi:8-oxo-dGTP pyrophosphatase MutT (NUDIX family)